MAADERPAGVEAETVETRRPPGKAVIDEHWCMHAGCKRWGSFGFATRYGTEWYCGEHRGDGF